MSPTLQTFKQMGLILGSTVLIFGCRHPEKSESKVQVASIDIKSPSCQVKPNDWRIPACYGAFVPVPVINQTVEPRAYSPSFDGFWACGATSALMATAYWGKLDPYNVTLLDYVTRDGKKISVDRKAADLEAELNSYRYFLLNSYEYIGPRKSVGSTFAGHKTRQDGSPKSEGGSGAWGRTTKEGSWNYDHLMVDYVKSHGLDVKDQTATRISVDLTSDRGMEQIKQRIQQGYPVIIGGVGKEFFAGHIALVKGITHDNKLIMNNPWAYSGGTYYPPVSRIYNKTDFGSAGVYYTSIRLASHDPNYSIDSDRTGFIEVDNLYIKAEGSGAFSVRFTNQENKPKIWGAYCWSATGWLSCSGQRAKNLKVDEKVNDWGNGDGEVKFFVWGNKKTPNGDNGKIFIVSPYASNSPVEINVYFNEIPAGTKVKSFLSVHGVMGSSVDEQVSDFDGLQAGGYIDNSLPPEQIIDFQKKRINALESEKYLNNRFCTSSNGKIVTGRCHKRISDDTSDKKYCNSDKTLSVCDDDCVTNDLDTNDTCFMGTCEVPNHCVDSPYAPNPTKAEGKAQGDLLSKYYCGEDNKIIYCSEGCFHYPNGDSAVVCGR